MEWGIDSTALMAQLLSKGYYVQAFAFNFYGQRFTARENSAIQKLIPVLRRLGKFDLFVEDMSWIWNFSHDGVEIPRRNKHIMDYLIVRKMSSYGFFNIAMGEYCGADTWVVRDHVSYRDADCRALESYLYLEYGMDYRLITLRDFGESRFKVDRLKLGFDVIGSQMGLTTNCMKDILEHCGECYKCVERACAFDMLGLEDSTLYLVNPRNNVRYDSYREQMSYSRGLLSV